MTVAAAPVNAGAYLSLEAGSRRADRVWFLFTLGVWAAMMLDGVLAPDQRLGAA